MNPIKDLERRGLLDAFSMRVQIKKKSKTGLSIQLLSIVDLIQVHVLFSLVILSGLPCSNAFRRLVAVSSLF